MLELIENARNFYTLSLSEYRASESLRPFPQGLDAYPQLQSDSFATGATLLCQLLLFFALHRGKTNSVPAL